MNSVENMINRIISYDDQVVIKNLGAAKPDLVISQNDRNKNGAYIRKFSRALYNHASWLCGCDKRNAFFCFVCLLINPNPAISDITWTKNGVTDLKHLSQKIKKHKKSARHIENEAVFALLGPLTTSMELQTDVEKQYELDFKRICRTCEKESSKMFPIFDTSEIIPRSDNLTLDRMIMECASVQVYSNDGLPQNMCKKCVKHLNTAYDFKKQCEQIDISLRAYRESNNFTQDNFDIKDEDQLSLKGSMDNDDDNQSLPEMTYSDEDQKHFQVSLESNNIQTDIKDVSSSNNLSSNLQKNKSTWRKRKIYVCKLCSNSYKTFEQLKQHLRAHLKNKPFQCRLCNRGYAIYESLLNHKKQCKGEPIYPCEICNFGFKTATSLEVHRKLHTRKPVLQILESLDNIDEHYMEVDESDLSDANQNGLPNKQGDNRTAFVDQSSEKLELPYIKIEPLDIEQEKKSDESCEENADSSDDDYIGPTKKKKKKIVCTICKKVFSRLYGLKRHMFKHSNSKPFNCEICLKTFINPDSFNQHKDLHKKFKEFECDICKQPFGSVDQLANHKGARHNIGERIARERKYECSVCFKGFISENYLTNHMRRIHSDDKRFSCKICRRLFSSETDLATHVETAHTKNFLCTECGHRFMRKEYLAIHMRRHRGEKPYTCKYCGKGFPRPADLVTHERYHTGEKIHVCATCGRRFCRSYSLKVHMRIHTGEKPYKCTYCDAAFTQRNDMKAHVRRHTGERYHCDLCDDNFLMGYLLTQHKRKIHGIQVESKRLEHFPPS